MDPYKLLSRSTKLSKTQPSRNRSIPSSGQNPQLQPLSVKSSGSIAGTNKRKRGQEIPTQYAELAYFGAKKGECARPKIEGNGLECRTRDTNEESFKEEVGRGASAGLSSSMPLEERKSILRIHKLKTTWLNPLNIESKDGRKVQKKKKLEPQKDKRAEKPACYPQPVQSFAELRTRFEISTRLAANLEDQGYTIPTEVQMAALPILLDEPKCFLSLPISEGPSGSRYGVDLLTVAPTGSGKTLAYMIPLLHDILSSRTKDKGAHKNTSSIILAPTKELAGQIVNEGRKLARGTAIRVTQVRKGMKFATETDSTALPESEESKTNSETVVKSDILVSTPGTMASILNEAQGRVSTVLSHVTHLILDEADVLLDPLFRNQTLSIWNNLPHGGLRVSLWSATMGSNIEEIARSTIESRRNQLTQERPQTSREAPLVRLVVGLKDSAVPNVQHRLVYAASEQGKLLGLRQLLHPTTSSLDSGPSLALPILVFTQTIERAIALHSELLYDIPVEAGGIGRIAVLHSDLSDAARDEVMAKFRKGEIWILITTDLLSRGVDFRGVNGVVNYDIPTSSAAYVHRVGRTGRAGREGGVAITLYSKEDIPFLKPIANLVLTAHKVRAGSSADEDSGVQQWLLEALPSLSKNARHDLKKRGVESRTARGMQNNPRAARKSRISTKSGFMRREENKRKGAVLGSRKRQEAVLADNADETDFGGFD